MSEDICASKAVKESYSPKVLAAMSGGVDSSVMAQMLVCSGYDVTGSTMLLCQGTPDDARDAQRICFQLGIDHVTFDFRELFEKRVMNNFCEEYICGRTPNPCIECNRYMKFASMQKMRREGGYDFVATGHYARRVFDEATCRWQLLRACDVAKDQSYFLYRLTQEDLRHTLFPLGDLTKTQVREIAKDAKLPSADRAESQDICFVPDGDYVSFIERHLEQLDNERSDSASVSEFGHDGNVSEGDYLGIDEVNLFSHAFEPGEIVDVDGNVLGKHSGLIRYTVGQRKGIGIASSEPLYVLAKDVSANRLVVAHAHDITTDKVVAGDINFVSVDAIKEGRRIQVKTHYRQKPVDGIVSKVGNDTLEVQYITSQRPSSPGQSLVVYDGDVLLGGGIIV